MRTIVERSGARGIALLVSCSLSASILGGCFPHNPRHRTYAQLTEGGLLVGGIALLTVAGTGADCDVKMVGDMNDSCQTKASVLGNIGLGLIIAGLVGFIATVSTAEDDKPAPNPNAISPTPPAPATIATPPVAPEPAPAPSEPAPAPAPAP